MNKKEPMRGYELSKLKNSTDNVIFDKTLSEGFSAPVKGVTEHINTKSVQRIASPLDAAKKVADFRAARALGKRAMGVIPFAGTAYAALNGDPAMAAEEAMGDVPFVGQAYEAMKSDNAGMSSSDERQILAERDAEVNYRNSPAHQARLKVLQQFGK